MSLLQRISLLKSSSERLKKSTITLREGEICLVDTKGEGYDSLIIGDGNTQAKDLPLFSLSAGIFMGEATPETDLSIISGDSYYFTKTPGKYLGGNIEVGEGEVAFLIYKYKGWKKETILTVDQEVIENSTNPVSGAAVTKALKNKISEIEDINGLKEAIAAGATVINEKKTGHITVSESVGDDGKKTYTIDENDIASVSNLPEIIIKGGNIEMKSDKATISLTPITKAGNNGAYAQGANVEVDIELATTSLSGLMSPEDKVRLDSIYGRNLQLVTPTLSGSWKYFKNDGVTAVSLSGSTIEQGYKAQWTGTYKWNSASGKKNPTKVVSGNWTTLTADGVSSERYTSPVIGSNTTIKIQLGAPKTGLMVSGSNVQPASGDDTTQATTSMSFSTRIFKGTVSSNNPTEAEIKALSNELGGKARTINGVSTEKTQYWLYAYPKSLGVISKIIQDGATPVLGAFTRIDTMTITNGAGYSVPLYIYITNNPGAFTNASLQFS